MDYLNLELDDEELTTPRGPPAFHFNITEDSAIKFLESQVNTYKQFKRFPTHHKSYKSLQYTGAMYEYILSRFKDPSSR